jgi:hypothetical protein
MSITVLDPTPGAVPSAALLAPRLPDLRGRTVALLDNGKKNVLPFLDHLERVLRGEYGVETVVRRRKRNQNAPAPPALLVELAQADAVVSAVGD